MDSVKRSLVKAVTWRIVATFITALLVLIITGSVDNDAGGITTCLQNEVRTGSWGAGPVLSTPCASP